MSIINKPNTFSPNTTIGSSQVNSNFDTLYNDYNGSISAANLASNAVTTAKIADANVTTAKIADGAVTNAKVETDFKNGWINTGGTHSVATGYNSGNRSFEIDTSTDLSGIVSPGMRYKVDRSVAPPDQCADLEASSSQYASKSSPAGITFTDDFTCEAWIKLESYTGSAQQIINRQNSSTEGWAFRVGTSGQLEMLSLRIASNNRTIASYQSIPLGKWVHVAGHMDNSSNSHALYIDGVSVPFATTTNGTITALVQGTTPMMVGGQSVTAGTGLFDGKLADVRVWSDIRTADEIRDNMYAYPSDTTGLVAHFKLDGDFTDSSTNGNDLTAQNSAVATNADNPWNATEYGVITNVTSSTIQVFCPEGYGIPNETLSAPFYSTQDTPYGFPRDKGKFEILVLLGQSFSQNTPTSDVWYNNNIQISVPLGAWDLGYNVNFYQDDTAGELHGTVTLSTGNSTESDIELSSYRQIAMTGANFTYDIAQVSKSVYKNLASSDIYYLNIKTYNSGYDLISIRGSIPSDSSATPSVVFARCAYI